MGNSGWCRRAIGTVYVKSLKATIPNVVGTAPSSPGRRNGTSVRHSTLVAVAGADIRFDMKIALSSVTTTSLDPVRGKAQYVST